MKIVVLGSTGFLGKNLMNEHDASVNLIPTSRKKGNSNIIYFDILIPGTWDNILEIKPDIIINAVAYGVVKWQVDLDMMYKTNYLQPMYLYKWLKDKGLKAYWFQLGTAFEYQLKEGAINEQSACIPETHYGISKFMMSNFLLNDEAKNFCIIRPFGMFGAYEDKSKFFPLLINAQKEKGPVSLSSGLQKRDYIHVKSVTNFLISLCFLKSKQILPQIINIGSGKALSFRDYAETLKLYIPAFNPTYWNWNMLAQREGESNCFYADNKLALSLGLHISSMESAFANTVNHYYE